MPEFVKVLVDNPFSTVSGRRRKLLLPAFYRSKQSTRGEIDPSGSSFPPPSLRARATDSPRKPGRLSPAVAARKAPLVRKLRRDRPLNAACHPILLKHAAPSLMLTKYLTNRGLSSLAAANSCVVKYAEDYSNFPALRFVVGGSLRGFLNFFTFPFFFREAHLEES